MRCYADQDQACIELLSLNAVLVFSAKNSHVIPRFRPIPVRVFLPKISGSIFADVNESDKFIMFL